MHQAIKNELRMRYRHGKCLRKVGTLPFFLLYIHSLPLPQHRRGLDTPHGWAAHAVRSQLPNGDVLRPLLSDDHPSMPAGGSKGWSRSSQELAVAWPASQGLKAQCQNFHCPPEQRTDCCCRRAPLFTAGTLLMRKSQLQELIESRRHLCGTFTQSTTVN